jgi:hypothetical protein
MARVLQSQHSIVGANQTGGRMLIRKLTVGLVFALLMAACGSSDDTATTETTATVDSEQSGEDETMDDEMASEETSEDEMSDETAMDDEMSDEHMPTTFIVTITNTSDTAELATPIAPGAYAVHTSMDTLFVEGQADRGEGLEALAEDGDPSALAASLAATATVSSAAAFAKPDSGSEAGPALPGSSYSFTFEGIPGDYLSFATMFVQSNDWFFSPPSSGISLFDGNVPLDGDITTMIGLWDAGTEADETPGEGPNQAPRQSGPNTGGSQGAPITAVEGYDGTISVSITVGA